MKPCVSCAELRVDPEEPPLYDVLNADYNPALQPMSAVGPYCPECWPSTATSKAIAAQAAA